MDGGLGTQTHTHIHIHVYTYWVVEANLAPIWRRQSGNLAKLPIWCNLAMHNLAIWKNTQSGQSGNQLNLASIPGRGWGILNALIFA